MSHPGVDLVVVINGDWVEFSMGICKAMLMVIYMLGSKDRLAVVSPDGGCIMGFTFMSNKGQSLGRLMVEKLERMPCGDLAVAVGAGAKVCK